MNRSLDEHLRQPSRKGSEREWKRAIFRACTFFRLGRLFSCYRDYERLTRRWNCGFWEVVQNVPFWFFVVLTTEPAWSCVGSMFHSGSVGTMFGSLGIHTVSIVFRQNETYSSLLVVCVFVWLLVVQGIVSISCKPLEEVKAGRTSVALIVRFPIRQVHRFL